MRKFIRGAALAAALLGLPAGTWAAPQTTTFYAQAGQQSYPHAAGLTITGVTVNGSAATFTDSNSVVTITSPTLANGDKVVETGTLAPAPLSGNITLGTTAGTVAAGNDSRLSDTINAQPDAKPDAVTVTDGAMTATSSALTANSATWGPSDVGKVISVLGAGASGGSLISTIQSVTGPHMIQLAAPATTTVSSTTVYYGTNNQAAFQAVINRAAASASAAIVIVPKGDYLLKGGLTIPSKVTVACRPGASFDPITSAPVFVNTNGQRNWATDYTAPTTANITDSQIDIHGCTVDYTRSTQAEPGDIFGAGLAVILLADRVNIYDNTVIGDPTGLNRYAVANAVRIAKATNSRIHNNRGTGLYNGVGIWGGAQFVYAEDNDWTIAPNTYNANAFSCSNINGAGTAPNDHQITQHVGYRHNTCTINGGTGGFVVVAYNNGALSAGSALNDFDFEGNKTIASGVGNTCYSANGALAGHVIQHNRFENCDISTFAMSAKAVSYGTQTNPITTVSGSASVTVSVPGVTTSSVVVGNYLNLSGATAVGGLTLSGPYRITAVAADSVVIAAGATASSNATGGGSVTESVYWGRPTNPKVADNEFINSNSSGNGLITVLAPGAIVKDNFVEGGTYGSITLTSYRDCCSTATSAVQLSGNRGAAGSGVTTPLGGFAVSGDTFSAYETGFTPTNLDNAQVTANTSWTPNLLIGGSATGITYTTQTGTYSKVGKVVSLCGQIALNSKGVGTGAVTISGLPFAADAENQTLSVAYIANTSGITFPAPFLSIAASTSSVKLFTDSTLATTITNANLANSTFLQFCGSYRSI